MKPPVFFSIITGLSRYFNNRPVKKIDTGPAAEYN